MHELVERYERLWSQKSIWHDRKSEFPTGYVSGRSLTRLSSLSKDHQGPRAVLNALERIATGYAAETVRVRQDLSIAESQLRDSKARLVQPFPNEAYLSELTGLRDQLKAGLPASHQESPNQKGPRACPNSPAGSSYSKPLTPSRPRRSASNGSYRPPRNRSPPVAGRRHISRSVRQANTMPQRSYGAKCITRTMRIHPARRLLVWAAKKEAARP
jgi:hypothetical protein